MKRTAYFLETSKRADRVNITEKWIESAMQDPDFSSKQSDGRIRFWKRIPEFENRFLRVIVLEDGETVHNAFWDRTFRGE